MMTTYQAVIGLEIHVQLNSPTKLFCDCPNAPGDKPNLNICPICLWLPGAIPQFSQTALEHAAITCLALNCEVQTYSTFDQKVYYYPDLPKGYQLSQHHHPLSRSGWLDIAGEDGTPYRVRIHHVHMEEDVARLVHETEGHTRISLVDFNRAGVPLVEIVTEPDMSSPYYAMEFLKALRQQIRYAGTAECSMESGTMRCDANISLRPSGTDEMNPKVEVKNMNSIRAVGNAIQYEINRQTELNVQGKVVTQHTRLWDAGKNMTIPMRGKFSGPCIPDPSLPPVQVSIEWIADRKARLPEMPGQKKTRFTGEYGLTDDEAALLSSERETADYFEAMVEQHRVPAHTAAQWMVGRLLPILKERGETPDHTVLTPFRMAELLHLLDTGAISAHAARDLLMVLFDSDKSANDLVEEHGFGQVHDTGVLGKMVDSVIDRYPSAVEDVHNGKVQAAEFLVGQAMRASQGKADPKTLRELIERRIINR